MAALPDFADPNALYVVDLSGFVHRYWHVLPGMAARNFGTMLQKVIESRAPARLAIAEDTVFPTFRHELATDYKAGRPDRSGRDRASQQDQLNRASQLAQDVYGVRCLAARGFEADDIIATLALWGVEEGLRVVIMGFDKDLKQLVTSRVVMWDGKGTAAGPAEVAAEFGVTSAQIVDYLTIVGDSCDNVAGIKGIGEKGAIQILERFGRLDTALEEANAEGPDRGANHPFFQSKPKLWAKLFASRRDVDRARSLVRLRHDVPLKLSSLDELRLEP